MGKSNILMRKILRETYSVCPVCLQRIPAAHVTYGKEIYLEKTCPKHGDFSTVIWRGISDINQWRGKLPTIAEGENENCPHNCGICSEHQQGTCCVLLEVTKRCNLACSFCFAEGEAPGAAGNDDIPFEKIKGWLYDLAVPGQTLVQLSGGEPTVRNDLPEIVAEAKKAGCKYVQLNSNGVRLAQDEGLVKELAEAGLSFVFMQFDGTDDSIYRKLRGGNLLEIKKQAIENCNKYNIGVTLVPTVVPGINGDDIGNIIRFAISKAPAVRGVHFQPVSYFGRIPSQPSDEQRYTLDELIEAIENQGGGLVPKSSLTPSRCDHPLCGFHGDYIAMSDQTLYPMRKTSSQCCCGSPAQDDDDTLEREVTSAEQNRLFVAKRWERPAGQNDIDDKDQLSADDDIETLEGFLKRVRSHSFTITAMAFQDAGNLDLERLRRCSLHVFCEGRLVPFCSHYLTKQ
jgi:uncharacterized radical SAM superfamily Fe-S cluster-containing enzyme